MSSTKQCVICENQGENVKIHNSYGCESSCDTCRIFFGLCVKKMTKSRHTFLGGKNSDRHCYNNFDCELKGKRACTSCRFLKCIENQMNPELPLKNAAKVVLKTVPTKNTKELGRIYEANLNILLSAAHEARANSNIMPPKSKAYMRNELREVIVAEKERGKTNREIAAFLNISHGTVGNIWNHWKSTGTVHPNPKSGRPQKTSPQFQRSVCRASRQDADYNGKDVQVAATSIGLSISRATACRILQKKDLNGRRAAKVSFISEENRIARFQWCQEHKNWTFEKWCRVVFSDESRFLLHNPVGGQYIRRPKGTVHRYEAKYVKGVKKFGGGGVTMWGCFSANHLGPLVYVPGRQNSQSYVLQDHYLPWVSANLPNNAIFQQDNASCHVAKEMMGYEKTLPNGRLRRVPGWFSRKNVTVLRWPASSADLSPIEHLWGIFKNKLQSRRFKKEADLVNYVQAEWQKLDPAILLNLIRTMPERIRACIKAKGSYFKI